MSLKPLHIFFYWRFDFYFYFMHRQTVTVINKTCKPFGSPWWNWFTNVYKIKINVWSIDSTHSISSRFSISTSRLSESPKTEGGTKYGGGHVEDVKVVLSPTSASGRRTNAHSVPTTQSTHAWFHGEEMKGGEVMYESRDKFILLYLISASPLQIRQDLILPRMP